MHWAPPPCLLHSLSCILTPETRQSHVSFPASFLASLMTPAGGTPAGSNSNKLDLRESFLLYKFCLPSISLAEGAPVLHLQRPCESAASTRLALSERMVGVLDKGRCVAGDGGGEGGWGGLNTLGAAQAAQPEGGSRDTGEHRGHKGSGRSIINLAPRCASGRWVQHQVHIRQRRGHRPVPCPPATQLSGLSPRVCSQPVSHGWAACQ